jgi:ubiquitin C-terminal hydrolase
MFRFLFDDFSDEQQHDAYEFIAQLLARLHFELAVNPFETDFIEFNDFDLCGYTRKQRARIAWNYHASRFGSSAISHELAGLIECTTSCSNCRIELQNFEVFYDLNLPIPTNKGRVDVYDCLREYGKDEELRGSDDRCPNCLCVARSRRIRIAKVPVTLILRMHILCLII